MAHSSDNNGATPLAGIIQGRNHLGSLVARARAYGQLEQRILRAVPGMEPNRIRVACIRERCLVLSADSPTWATRARTLSGPILAEAARHWPTPLDEVRIITSRLPDSLNSGSRG